MQLVTSSTDLQRKFRASPIAKRLAAEHGIDLAAVNGTGPAGRIVEADVRAAMSRSPNQETISDLAPGRRIPMSIMRRRIGERLRGVVDNAVSVTLTREVRAEALVAARARLTERLGQAISYDAFFVKLLAAGLRQFPQLNATIDNGELVVFSEINIGFAVALEDGLLVPVIRAADTRTLEDVAMAVTQTEREGQGGPIDAS